MNERTVKTAIEVREVRRGVASYNTRKLGIKVFNSEYDNMSDDDIEKIYNEKGVYGLFLDIPMSCERMIEVISIKRQYFSLFKKFPVAVLENMMPLSENEIDYFVSKEILGDVPEEIRIEVSSISIDAIFNKAFYIEDYCVNNKVQLSSLPSYNFFETCANHFSDKDKLYLIGLDDTLGMASSLVKPSSWLAFNIIKEAKSNRGLLYRLFKDDLDRKEVIHDIATNSMSTFMHLIESVTDEELDIILKADKGFLDDLGERVIKNISEKFWLTHLEFVLIASSIIDIPLYVKRKAVESMKLGKRRDYFISKILRTHGVSASEEMFEWIFRQAFI